MRFYNTAYGKAESYGKSVKLGLLTLWNAPTLYWNVPTIFVWKTVMMALFGVVTISARFIVGLVCMVALALSGRLVEYKEENQENEEYPDDQE